MYRLDKIAISQFIRTECQRQLRFNLLGKDQRSNRERQNAGMPLPVPPRPGLPYIVAAGREWEHEKFSELLRIFGDDAVVARSRADGGDGFVPFPLAEMIDGIQPTQFLLETQFEVGAAVQQAHSLNALREETGLNFSEARPDIIMALPAGRRTRQDGRLVEVVTPSGHTFVLPEGDQRIQLRVIDIKLTAEPSPGYFAEIAYYSMALAGWLEDQRKSNRFVVVSEGAVWPGSHELSNLTLRHGEFVDRGETAPLEMLLEALELDLESIPFDVFALRLRRLLQEELPEVLRLPWQDLDWHVDNRCVGCDYLGYPWPGADIDPQHCMSLAEGTGHLSRIAFITRGASKVLRQGEVRDVPTLAQTPPQSEIFSGHQALRASRTVLSGRATALTEVRSYVPPESGTSATMPKWTDLHVYLSCDFDLGSAITFSFGLEAFWMEPLPFGAPARQERNMRSWDPRVFVVNEKSIEVEQRELLAFLAQIHEILSDPDVANSDSTVQIYIWDELRYKHLCRVIGRHLHAILANQDLMHLAWLFPPEDILPNPQLESRSSPITIVQRVVRAVIAVPVPHYYNLLAVARCYHHDQLPEPMRSFSVHPLFEDALSDQIPSERAHEIWSRSTNPGSYWLERIDVLRETVTKHLQALESVTRRLEGDLREQLGRTAPRIRIEPPERASGVSIDGQLWYAFTCLNNALQKLNDVDHVRAMPTHEREARFRSARLTERLTGDAEQEALETLNILPDANRRVYRLNEESREIKAKVGDFAWALAPANTPGFLDQSFARTIEGSVVVPNNNFEEFRWRMENATGVTIVGLDREGLIIAIDANAFNRPGVLNELEAGNVVDLGQDVMLDPVHVDVFTRKLREALRAIGSPAIASVRPLVQRAVGAIRWRRRPRRTAHTPPADLLWSAPALHNTVVDRDLSPVEEALRARNLDLNDPQWRAWREAMRRRLQLIWGPPGTGKSRTVVALVVGACIEALDAGRPFRVLVSAATWAAIDNVLLPCVDEFRRPELPLDVLVRRVRSSTRDFEPDIRYQNIDAELNWFEPSQTIIDLRARLEGSQGVTLVGTTPDQVHNLMKAGDEAQEELFDVIVIDEATQMDVAHAVVTLCALANESTVILAGDDLQLPPIQQAEAPAGLGSMVGSIYTFCKDVHEVSPEMLERNYRSNSEIVEFSRRAGYGADLIAHSPDLQLQFLSDFPAMRPENWPGELYWTSEWAALLDPNHPAVCFIYEEGLSSQWNQFEADALAALIWLMHGRLANQLDNEITPNGDPIPSSDEAYTPQEFWSKGVGVVTPHRAQQGLITSRLQGLFIPMGVDASLVRSAVDTVERFQGQQRDIVLATFALGDPDAIRDEDEFLLSLNRFNVMASRARAKLIVFLSREVADHLSHDLDVLHGSKLLKVYAETFCGESRPMELGYVSGDQTVIRRGAFRYHEA